MSLQMCHLLFALKKIFENALRVVTDEYLNILPCSAGFTPVDGPTMLEVYNTNCMYKLMGFPINFLKKDFSVHNVLCLYIHNSRSKHWTSITSVRFNTANNCFQF